MLIPGCRVGEQEAMLFGTPKTTWRGKKVGKSTSAQNRGREALEERPALHCVTLLFLGKPLGSCFAAWNQSLVHGVPWVIIANGQLQVGGAFEWTRFQPSPSFMTASKRGH